MTRHRQSRIKQQEFPPGSPQNEARPVVAIVGRPNVGKSTLFNRIVGRRVAIVHDEPGVTRDRHYADAWFGGRSFTLVDTGGFDPDSDDPIAQGIARQIEIAIAEADVIIFVADGSVGLTTSDEQAVTLLRRTNKPVLFAANKSDSPRIDAEATDFYRLGVSRVFGVSALHGRGMHELESAMLEVLPAGPSTPEPEDDIDDTFDDEFEPSEEDDEDEVEAENAEPEQPAAPIRVALVGRPNAGKSSLINKLAGEERVLVDSRPGTTVDAIDTVIEHGGREYVFIDTAGIRRKSKVSKANSVVEAVSVLHAIRAIERCEVVVLMCDAAEGVAEQDAKVLGLAVERGRAVIIALNKADLLDAKALKQAEERARDKLTFAPWAPIVTLSAQTGRGLNAVMKTVDRVYEGFNRRVTTGKLNRFFENVLATHPPPTSGGKAPRLYFITQARIRPPLFVVMSNNPEAIHFSYQRFVSNQLRQEFDYAGVPIRIRYKARRKKWWTEGEGEQQG
ncbi:MAG: ribosome biogenesis GTPase Der [Polyangiaceae bacterium]